MIRLQSQMVKNIARPVHAWQVLAEAGASTATVNRTKRVARKYWRKGSSWARGLTIVTGLLAESRQTRIGRRNAYGIVVEPKLELSRHRSHIAAAVHPHHVVALLVAARRGVG